jgi:hypothetical protein
MGAQHPRLMGMKVFGSLRPARVFKKEQKESASF